MLDQSVVQQHKLLYSGVYLLFIICIFSLSMKHKKLTKYDLILALQGWLMVPDATKWKKQYMAPCFELNNWVHKHEALAAPDWMNIIQRV